MLQPVEIDAYFENKRIYTYRAVANAAASCGSTLLFLSMVMTEGRADGFLRGFARNSFIVSLNRSNVSFDAHNIIIDSQKGRNGYVHILLRQKLDGKDRSPMPVAFFRKSQKSIHDTVMPEDIVEKTADTIMEYTSIPFLREWAPYVCEELRKQRNFSYADMQGLETGSYGFRNIVVFDMHRTEIENIISRGLREHKISIDGCNASSTEFTSVRGVDSYQEKFGAALAEQTKRVFKPAFDPKKEKVSRRVTDFFDICTYYNPRFRAYEVQKHVMEAGRRCLERLNNFILAGETGSGKTMMSIGTVFSSAKRGNYSVLCMVPSKLVSRWQEGIRSTIQMADVRVVTDFRSFLSAVQALKNPLRVRSLWIIMSENTAKANYAIRPGVVWSATQKCFICPHCGRPIAIRHLVQGRYDDGPRQPVWVKATTEDFLAEPKQSNQENPNAYCTKVFDAKGGVTDGCGAKLWTAATRGNSLGGCRSELWHHPADTSKAWIKITKLGWVRRDLLPQFKEDVKFRLDNLSENATAYEKRQLQAQQKAIATYESRGASPSYPHACSIAHYMRKHLNKQIDFGIFDEVHNLIGDSAQGRAFGNVTNSVKKSIFLTGTLSNGYAAGMFHLLFRTQTRKMIEDGFDYNSVSDFENKYGVSERTQREEGRMVRRSNGERVFRVIHRRRLSAPKQKPGISPTLVADYLMDNMISVSKKDIKKNLCPYKEVPVGIPMDDELREAYDTMVHTVVQIAGEGRGRFYNAKLIRNALSTADMFLDQPFGLDTTRRDNDELIELSPSTVRNKEEKLIEICREKKENGEKVLVYVQWTGKLDLLNRLPELLEKNGIKAAAMDSRVKANERQDWLAEKAKDVDAVILNPALVDVGMNLLDYTTIVFYEVGQELKTVRQASQRSNRINQTRPVSVYFLYYQGTIQEDSLALISQKLKAAKAVEGNFSESALQDMTEDNDILTKLVNSIVKNEHIRVDEDNFEGESGEADGEAVEEEAVKAPLAHFTPTHFSFDEPKKVRYFSMVA